jgi:DUF971 family protein
MTATPTKVEPLNATEILIAWNDGAEFSAPYFEVRYFCPCAGCVDEHTGKRTIKKESIRPEVKPVSVQPVGRYAIQFTWSDGHATGIYHFETLRKICETAGKKR